MEDLSTVLIRDLAEGPEPLATMSGTFPWDVRCVLCSAEGPASRPGDEFQHELSCPWLRAAVLQIERGDD